MFAEQGLEGKAIEALKSAMSLDKKQLEGKNKLLKEKLLNLDKQLAGLKQKYHEQQTAVEGELEEERAGNLHINLQVTCDKYLKKYGHLVGQRSSPRPRLGMARVGGVEANYPGAGVSGKYQ